MKGLQTVDRYFSERQMETISLKAGGFALSLGPKKTKISHFRNNGWSHTPPPSPTLFAQLCRSIVDLVALAS